MDNIKITIRNYRSIPYTNPITLEIGEGITFILGVNNIGKSNLLKLFYEFRQSINPTNLGNGRLHFTPTSLFYSNVKNQNSKQDEINIDLEYNNKKIVFNIKPVSPDNLDHPDYYQSCIANNEPTITPLEMLEFSRLFSQAMYIGAFRTPTFQTSAKYYDIEIGQLFIRTWDNWANGPNTVSRRKIRVLKNELKELFGFSHFDIYPNGNNTNLIVETDDGEFNLDELGGGISHFILVLGNALIREPSFIFIDEPENSLHPKMQEIFIRTLASKAKYGLVATSHSIGLARSVGADKIYSLSKKPDGKLNLSRYGDAYTPSVTNAINELGYSQFVELGGNNILLVEGTGDIKSFKEILRKYGIEHHFIVMDLGGSGLISASRHEELDELKRLNAKSYNVIFDSEISKKGEVLKKPLKEFEQLCLKLGFNVFPTEVHSTDNYITQDAINKMIGSSYTTLGPYENLNERPKENKWGKSINWKMFREMDKSDFDGTELNKFITNVLIPLTK